MNCKLLLSTAVFLLGTSAFAQDFYVKRGMPNATEAEGNSVVLSYSSYLAYMQVGLGREATIAAASYYPEDMMSVYKGCTIDSVQIALWDDCTDGKILIWNLPTDETPLFEQSVGNMSYGWAIYKFDKPFEITGDAIYVGYENTGMDQVALSDVACPNSLFLRNSDGSWSDMYAANGWNALCLRLYISGVMPEREMALKSVDDIYVQTGKDYVVSGVVENLVPAEVTEYEMVCEIDGVEKARQTFTTSLGANDTETFRLQLPAIESEGSHTATVYIEKVNGEADASQANNTATKGFDVKDLLFDRKVVLEEGTGTWCQYCVRGIVGIREMKALYPETFIPIAVHNGDEMAVSAYQTIISQYMTGLPGSVMNRKLVLDPNFEDIRTSFLAEFHPVNAGIEAEAAFVDENRNSISVKTKTTFGLSYDDANYRIAVVLLENEVEGYAQANAYANNALGEMGGFEDLPRTVEMNMNEVARGIYKIATGVRNSVPATIEKGVAYDFEYTITETEYEAAGVQDDANIEVVVMLIDMDTEEIINADKVKVEAPKSLLDGKVDGLRVYAEDGKIVVEGDYDNFTVTDIAGMSRVNENLDKGVYIVEIFDDGLRMVRKVAVR